MKELGLNYPWKDPTNAIGFAAACLREVLQFYKGGKRAALMKALEFAEACSHGESVTYDAASAPHAVNAAVCATAHAAYVVAGEAADEAARAGVSQDVIDKLRTRWIVKDLGGDPNTEIGRAMFALVTRGAYDEAGRLVCK